MSGCAVLFASWFRVHIPQVESLRRALVDVLAADVLLLLTYREDDKLAGSEFMALFEFLTAKDTTVRAESDARPNIASTYDATLGSDLRA